MTQGQVGLWGGIEALPWSELHRCLFAPGLQGLRLVLLEPCTAKSCWVSSDPLTTSQVRERF